jgi:drug/metabolite transporter (DMT)-like permease
MILAYGVANLLQSMAARHTSPRDSLHPGIFVRLAGHKTYLIGLLLQLSGFALAFLARRDLPLFLVQASAAAGLGVTALLGVLLLKWRLPPAEIVLLVLLSGGIAAQVVAARPGPARPIGPLGVAGLTLALLVVAALALPAVRLRGAPGSVVLGALAGTAFGSGAIASRPLADSPSAHALTTSPLLYLLIAHSILAQLLLALAMQRGSTTSAVAAMDAASAVPAALVGVAFLGDRIRPGFALLGGAGFVLAIAAVVGLTRYARPQSPCTTSTTIPIQAVPLLASTTDLVGTAPRAALTAGDPVTLTRSTTGGGQVGLGQVGGIGLDGAGGVPAQGDQEADHRGDAERHHRAAQRGHQAADHARRVPVRPDRQQQRSHPRGHPQHQQPDGRQVPGPARP